MNLRQLIRFYRTGVFSGEPQVEFINLRSPRMQVDIMSTDGPIILPTYGVNVVIDAALGNVFSIIVTNGVAFQVNLPLNPPAVTLSQVLEINISNASGGAHGAITMQGGAGGYRMAGAIPAIANGSNRTFTVQWFGNVSLWRELYRTAADVANA